MCGFLLFFVFGKCICLFRCSDRCHQRSCCFLGVLNKARDPSCPSGNLILPKSHNSNILEYRIFTVHPETRQPFEACRLLSPHCNRIREGGMVIALRKQLFYQSSAASVSIKHFSGCYKCLSELQSSEIVHSGSVFPA